MQSGTAPNTETIATIGTNSLIIFKYFVELLISPFDSPKSTDVAEKRKIFFMQHFSLKN